MIGLIGGRPVSSVMLMHAADQIPPDADPVALCQVRLDVTDRQPAGVQRQDLVVKPRKASLVLLDEPGLKAAVAIPRRADRNRPMLAHKRLRRRTVARVSRPPAAPDAARNRDGGSARPLSPAPADAWSAAPKRSRRHDLLLGLRAGQQLVDDLARQALAGPRAAAR